MDFLHFIRLIKRNIIILIGIPFLLALVTYYFTRTKEKSYESEAVIYTGITTGYSIESTNQRSTDFFQTTAQFDNMINLLKSRQTVVETALILLAQDLSLEHDNPQYISYENYQKLQSFIPKRVKDLVVKNNKSGIQREKEEQIQNLQKEIHSLESEIVRKRKQAELELAQKTSPDYIPPAYQANNNHNKKSASTSSFVTYTVKPGESLSSIASRYGISRGELIQMNNLSYGNVSPGQRLIIKKSPSKVTTAKYHVVKPGETLFSIAKNYGVNINKLRELNNLNNRNLVPGQKIIISSGVSNYNSPENYNKTYSSPNPVKVVTSSSYGNGTGPNDVFVKDPIVPPGVKKSDFDKTVANLKRYYASSDTNFIYGLLHYGSNNHYSINAISKIQIFRISQSDLVKLTFTSDDPGICQQTVKIISKVFMQDYKSLRITETDNVVEYFKREVDSADRKLSEAEDRLLRFNKRNNIINYYEQSKAIALQKEALDKYYQDQQIKMSGASATLQQLETKMTAKDSIYLKSDEIGQFKKQLADISEKIIVNKLAQNYNSRVASRLKILEQKQKNLRSKIKFYVDQLYLYGHSTQGVSIKNLLNAWLNNTITYTEAKASLRVLTQRKLDFIRTYQKMAPLGAMLTRIEREIKVAEQTYLELLRSLNLAKMKQQNLEMSTNIKIVDPPYFPISPKPSKAKYLVVAAGFGGFILILFIIFMMEYFDTSLSTPSKVEERTKMKLIGAYPYLSSKHIARELSKISNRLVDMTIQNIKFRISKSMPPPAKPYVIMLFSTENEAGKTLIAHKIINRMRSMGDKVIFFNYKNENEAVEDEDFNQTYYYSIKNNFIDIENLQELIDTRYLRTNNSPYDYIFLEIPSIIYHTYPIKLLSEIDLAVFVMKSNRSYTTADETAINNFKEAAAGKEPVIILNEVEMHNLGDLLTEIPKYKRTWWNKLKKIIKAPTHYKISIKKEA